eukprot:9493841-Pyramimonas_sp.AAC.1
MEIWQEAASLSDWGLSDHAIVQLTIRPKAESPRDAQAIPESIFRSPRFARHVKAFLDCTDLDAMGTSERWAFVKTLLHEAARLARKELQRLPIGDGSEEAVDGRRIAARAIARAIWRQDAALAHTLIDSTEFGASHLLLGESG